METWAHQDRLGSTIAVSDDTGTVQEKITYASFGETDAQTGFPFKFTGQRYDPETGLYHYKARYYSPELGRFLQVDAIGYEADINLYTYVGNNSINLTDPLGLMPDGPINGPSDVIVVTGQQRVFRSNQIFRTLIPGQIAFDNGVTAALNGQFARSGFFFSTLFAEQVLVAVTLGQSSTIVSTTKTITTSTQATAANEGAKSVVQKTLLSRDLASRNQLTQISEGRGIVLSHPAKTADKVAARAGGNPADIQKVTSSSFTDATGRSFETHAFRNARTGEIIEPKTIINPRVP